MKNSLFNKIDAFEEQISKQNAKDKEMDIVSENGNKSEENGDIKNTETPENKIDEIINSCSVFSKYNMKIYIIIILVLMADGGEASVVSFLITVLEEQWKFSTFEKSLFGICGSLGALFGMGFAGTWSDLYGRKPIFILGNFIAAIFSILTAFSGNLIQYAICRFTYGFGVGIALAAASSLTTEVTSSRLRAWMLNIIWVFYPVGELYCAIFADYFLVISVEGKSKFQIKAENSIDPWRKLILCVAIPCFLSGILSILIDESPRYLLTRQNYTEAFTSIDSMLISNKKNPLTQDEKNQIISENEASITADKQTFTKNYKDIFSKDYLRITLLIAGSYYVMSTSWNGLSLIMPNVIQMKEKMDFKDSHDTIDKHAAYTSFIISALFEIPCTLLSSYLAEIKFLGRKGALMLSFLLCLIPSLLVSLSIPGFTAYLIVIRFMTTLPYGVMYIYNNEVYPTRIRSTALGIIGAFTRVSAILSPFIMFGLLEWGIYMPFIFMTILFALGILFSFLLPYESHGKNIK